MNSGSKESILLVEDEALIAMSEKMSLERYGYAVTTVRTGEQAVEIMRTGALVDLILMDIDLGDGMDGTQAAEVILQDHDIPVVFLSSHTEPEIVEKTEKITSYGYVVKSSSITVLDASIKMAFKLFDANRRLTDELSERKWTEGALQASEERFRVAQDLSPDGFTILHPERDSEGRIIDFSWRYENPAIARINGTVPEEVIGKNLLDVLPGHRSTPIFAAYLDVASTGNTRVMEEVSARDILSRQVWLRLLVVSMGEDIAVLAQDITERRTAEAELLEAKQRAQESEARTRFILRHNPNAIAVFDNDMNILMTSDRFLRDYNVRDEDIIGRNHYDVFPEIPERWREVHQRSLQGEVLRNDDDHFVRPDGSTTYTRWECRPWYHSDSRIGGMIAYTEVITERKQVEQALRASVARYDELVSRIPVGVYVLWSRADRHKEFEYVSDRWCSIHGLPREDVLADVTVVDDLVHPDDRERFIEQNTESARDETPFLWEGRFYTGEGKLVHLRIESTPEVFENGDIRWFGVTQDITERQRLQTTSELHSRLFQSMGQAVIATDLQGTVVHWNQMAELVYGWSATDAVGKNVLDLTPSSQTKEQAAEIMRKLAQGEKWSGEFAVQKSDGTSFPAYVTNTPVFDDNGAMIGVIGISTDITERKRIEDELAQQKAYLERILETTPDGFWMITPEKKIASVNAAYCRMSGYSKDELTGMQINDIEAVESPQETAERMKRIIKNGYETFETKHRRKDRSLLDVEVSVSRLDRADGDYLVVFCRDITQRKRDEERLRSSQAMNRALFDQALGAVYIADMSGKLIDVNRRACTQLGYSREELLEMTVFDLNAPDADLREPGNTRLLDAWRQWVPGDQHVREAIHVGKDGHRYSVLISTGAIQLGDTKVIAGTVLDISERKRSEERIRDLVTEKETLIKEIQHRIKNNINTMTSLLSLQAQTFDEPTTVAALEDARNRLSSLGVLYDHLYAIDARGQGSLREYCRVLVASEVEVFPHGSRVEVRSDIEEILLATKTLSTLGLIVNELVTNAMKYAFVDHPRPILTITGVQCDDQYTLTVRDNGSGTQEPDASKPSSGFGLMIVDALSDQLGGTIQFEHDNGMVATLEFPVDEDR